MAVCKKCGQVHVARTAAGVEIRACTGHIASGPQKGRACRNCPRKGQRVCGSHGGKARKALAKAAAQLAEQAVAKAARKLIPDAADRDPIGNPLERLLELASEADAFRESLRLLANKVDTEISVTTSSGAEQLRAEVAVYRVALKDVTDMLVAIARLDIEKMLARVTLAQAEQALASLRAGMDEAALTDEQKRTVMTSAGRHLRAVAG